MALTKTYASSQLIMVLNKNVSPNDLHEKTIALPYGFSHYNVSDSKVIWFDTVQECMDAVNAGKADYSYGHGYAVQYCANRSIFRNISLIPQDNMQQGICVGVVKPTDTNLLNIINKAIHVIPESELQTIIYRDRQCDALGICRVKSVAGNSCDRRLRGAGDCLFAVAFTHKGQKQRKDCA